MRIAGTLMSFCQPFGFIHQNRRYPLEPIFDENIEVHNPQCALPYGVDSWSSFFPQKDKTFLLPRDAPGINPLKRRVLNSLLFWMETCDGDLALPI